MLKEEHKSNLKDLTTKMEDMEMQLRFKNEKIADMQKQLTNKDSDLQK